MLEKSFFDLLKEELGFDTGGYLRATNEDFFSLDELSNISEWVALEKAQKIGADFVYFRRFERHPSQALIYVFDYSERARLPEEPELGQLQKDIWSSSEVPCAFIFSKDSVRILNTSQKPETTAEGFLPVDLVDVVYEINEEIRRRFSSFKLNSGEFWNVEGENFSYEKSAHKTLLDKLKNTRENIINTDLLPAKLVNRLLIQCVLIRFLEEKQERDKHGNMRKVFPEGFYNQIAGVSSFREALEKGTYLKIFDYLNDPGHLNGKIFEWPAEERELLSGIPSKELVNLLYETDKDANSQLAFWDLYSFQFLPVEVISSIYEALFSTDDSVKEEGMVYTPPHLAAFLIDEAMPLNDWRNKSNYKILDPSCGSGVFLVLAFKRLVHWWRLNNGGKAPKAEDLVNILDNCIYGIDNNENAVLLTRFSLCLAVCDMLSPLEIWSSLRFPALEEKLVHSDFFTWEQTSNSKNNFDLIIGNPPFVQAHKNLPDWKTISDVKIPQKQVALYFLCAARKLVKDNGLVCLLLKSSSILYTTSGNDFRDWFFSTNEVNQIIDFTLLARNHVLWPNQEPDALALFATKKTPEVSSNILHVVVKRTPAIKLKRYFEIDPYDYHWVPYTTALQDDYVWKCNLLGGGRLYSLIKHLKSFPTLMDFVNENKDWALSGGYRTQNKPNKSKSTDERGKEHITGRKYIPSEWFTEDGIKSFEFLTETSEFFKHTGDIRAYSAPHVLIKANVGDQHSIPLWYFPDLNIRFREKIIGISAPQEDEHLLEEIFNYIKRFNQTLRAFLFSTSPECLINMNTLVQVKDVKNLPVALGNKLNEDLFNPKNPIINDVVNHYQEFIRRPETTKVFSSISSSQLGPRLNSFASTFCDTLNKVYQKEEFKFRFSGAGTFHFNSFIFMSFSYGDHESPKVIDDKKKLPEISSSKIEQIVKLDKGYAHFKRILKIYENDYVYFIKPNRLLYWLDSAALRDADAVIADMVEPVVHNYSSFDD